MMQARNSGSPTASTAKARAFGRRVAPVAAALCLMMVMVCVLSGCAGGVSRDQVESDVNSSDIVAEGIVDSDYVNDSPYELVDFTVDGQEEMGEYAELAQMAGVSEIRKVDVSGTIRNANFETRFTAMVGYGKQGDAWLLAGDPEVTSSTTTPLKGVDTMEGAESASVALGSTKAEPSYSDFSATFEDNGGSYRSTASQTVSYDYWFATDSAKNTCAFVFDSDDGWVPEGDVQVSDTRTDWKLSGRTFELHERGLLPLSGTLESAITFAEAGDGGIRADYTLTHTPRNSAEQDLSVSGSAEAELLHQFGEGSFQANVNDQANEVSFECASANSSMVAGSGEVSTLNVDVTTGIEVPVSKNYSADFYEKGMKYTEVV